MGFLKVRKPAALLFDMCATMTKSHFLDLVLFAYFKKHAQEFLEEHFDNPVVKQDIDRLRDQSKKDRGPRITESKNRDELIPSVMAYVNDCMKTSPPRESDALSVFRFHVVFDGYARGKLETQVYSDVAFQMRHWSSDLKIKLYLFSNCWTEASKRFLKHTNHGDMNLLIEDHFDNSLGSLESPETFGKIASKLKLDPDEILFLTHKVKEALAAKKAGLSTILVVTHRRDLSLISDDERKLPYIRSFNEIAFTQDAPPASQLPPGAGPEEDENDKNAGPSKEKSSKSSSSTSVDKKSSSNLSKSRGSKKNRSKN